MRARVVQTNMVRNSFGASRPVRVTGYRRRCFLLGVGALLNLYVTACVSAGQPSNLTVVLERSNGTVAPQFYKIERTTIRSVGKSSFQRTTGTRATGTKTSTSSFNPDPEKLHTLLSYVREHYVNGSDTSNPRLAAPRRRLGDGLCFMTIESRAGVARFACDGHGPASLTQMINDIVPAYLR